jgi:hypothetical protein
MFDNAKTYNEEPSLILEDVIALEEVLRKALVEEDAVDDVEANSQLLGGVGARCAFFGRNYTRGCHWIPRMFA